MSSENNLTGQVSTTTVSSVAIQAGESRIIISVLKCGHLVNLQLAEAIPNLFEIGANQDESNKLLKDHEMLLSKLKSLEDHVWDLLCEADKTAEGNQEQGCVYDAMALTLKDAWDTLIAILDKRRTLLQLSSVFFRIAQEFATAIDQAEDVFQKIPSPNTVDSITERCQEQQSHKKALLERSLALLNRKQELTEFIELFKNKQPNANLEMTQGARISCLRIDSLVESLQDRRRQLDKHLKEEHRRQERVLQISQWHQQEDKVTCWLRNHIEMYLKTVQLGTSLTENEELLQKHKQEVYSAKEWTSAVEKLSKEATRLFALENHQERENLMEAKKKLDALYSDFWELMEERENILQEANGFFKSVNKAFDKLGNIEMYLTHLKMQDRNIPDLLEKQREAEIEIRNCTKDAFHKGQTLINKSAYSSGMTGIKEMIGYLQKRVHQLTGQSPTSTDVTLKKQPIITSLEEHLGKVSMWIQTINIDLERNSDPGWSITECEKVRNKLEELADQTKEALQCMDKAAQLLKEAAQTIPSDADVFAHKACLLDEKLKTLDQAIEEKLEVLYVYIEFLKSSKELKSHIQSLKNMYASHPESSTLDSANTQLQGVLDDLFSVQDMGQNCLNIIKMLNRNTTLKNTQVECIETIMDNLNREKAELTGLWATWQQNIDRDSSSTQWRSIKEQLRSAAHKLQELEDDLQPLSSLSLGNDFKNILSAQEKLNAVKDKFQKLNAETQQAVKISELLTREGTPHKETSGKINDLAQQYQRVHSYITEFEELFIKIMTFYKFKTELEIHLNSKPEPPKSTEMSSDNQLFKMSEQRTRIQDLYKQILNVGTDIMSTVKCSKYINISLEELQQQLCSMEEESEGLKSEMVKQEENPASNLYLGPTADNVKELNESFKDLKKKFNNLKFNYTKKADKGRNLKLIKNQIQQVEMQAEKIQILKTKVDNLEKKTVTAALPQKVDKADATRLAFSDLQKKVNEFSQVVQEYKQNLERTEDLHLITEECQFWCEDACATVVRVGRYSAECKTKESVEILLKQFNKFVEPTLPQQEERIQQLTDIAKHVYGPEEGLKCIEKILVKNKETLDSVNELCSYLKELEEKLEEPHKVPEISISAASDEVILPSSSKDASLLTDMDLQAECLAEDAVSGDEYECISPDDISLPPLAETPESIPLQSETEQDEQCCYSSHSMHVSSYSMQMQINASGKTVTDSYDLLTPVAYTDTSSVKREMTSTYTERFCSPIAGYKTESPSTHHSSTVNETLYSLNTSPSKAKPNYSMMNEMHETRTQHHTVYSNMEKTGQLHVPNNTSRVKDRLYATPDAFSGLLCQSDSAKISQRDMTTQEEIKGCSENHRNVIPSGQTTGLSKYLPNVTVKEGSPVTLEVEVTSFPEPTLTWWVAYNDQ
ncbi:coiled-coil domain-containing protein 141 isoform X2 [Spea bombifrons]|uniref:coiled-coil domain-containing protein 141 isoform X2 n=1 Tax=Spea bombifrons TaxID=233779 RepID=UPI0023493DD1|nr:coiled-coil domain-containing protein 141 isoform X2 [Spea bombifrons]